jgi:hypothetical protein
MGQSHSGQLVEQATHTPLGPAVLFELFCLPLSQ